jgi:uncharacterized protein YbbC (DUF1343 family)
MMASSKGWLSRKPSVTVVRMQGWQRGMLWQDLRLPWHRTSPNIPYASSPAYYVATGMLGGAAAADVGIGTENPFGYAGGRGVNPQAMLAYCQRLRWPGVSFSAYSRSGFDGVRLAIDPRSAADLTALDVYLLAGLNQLSGGRMLRGMGSSQMNLFHKVYGSDSLYRELSRGVSPASIVSRWQSYNAGFRSARQPYLMYP